MFALGPLLLKEIGETIIEISTWISNHIAWNNAMLSVIHACMITMKAFYKWPSQVLYHASFCKYLRWNDCQMSAVLRINPLCISNFRPIKLITVFPGERSKSFVQRHIYNFCIAFIPSLSPPRVAYYKAFGNLNKRNFSVSQVSKFEH